MAPSTMSTMLDKASISLTSSALLQQDSSSYQAQWSQWLEVGFAGAAAVASVYMCVVKILDRYRKKKDTRDIEDEANSSSDHDSPVQRDEAGPSITMADVHVIHNTYTTQETEGQHNDAIGRLVPSEDREIPESISAIPSGSSEDCLDDVQRSS